MLVDLNEDWYQVGNDKILILNVDMLHKHFVTLSVMMSDLEIYNINYFMISLEEWCLKKNRQNSYKRIQNKVRKMMKIHNIT